MATSHEEKSDKNTMVSTNQRLVTILLVLLIILVILIILGIIESFLMMGRGMMNGGTMSGNVPLVIQSNGESIFKTGIDADGDGIQNSMISGMGCSMCHGTDGHGSQMMGHNIPCNTFECLSADGYTEDLIKRAIIQGIAEDGRQLDPMMPRWQMSDSDLNDLINYLKTLP